MCLKSKHHTTSTQPTTAPKTVTTMAMTSLMGSFFFRAWLHLTNTSVIQLTPGIRRRMIWNSLGSLSNERSMDMLILLFIFYVLQRDTLSSIICILSKKVEFVNMEIAKHGEKHLVNLPYFVPKQKERKAKFLVASLPPCFSQQIAYSTFGATLRLMLERYTILTPKKNNVRRGWRSIRRLKIVRLRIAGMV